MNSKLTCEKTSNPKSSGKLELKLQRDIISQLSNWQTLKSHNTRICKDVQQWEHVLWVRMNIETNKQTNKRFRKQFDKPCQVKHGNTL